MKILTEHPPFSNAPRPRRTLKALALDLRIKDKNKKVLPLATLKIYFSKDHYTDYTTLHVVGVSAPQNSNIIEHTESNTLWKHVVKGILKPDQTRIKTPTTTSSVYKHPHAPSSLSHEVQHLSHNTVLTQTLVPQFKKLMEADKLSHIFHKRPMFRKIYHVIVASLTGYIHATRVIASDLVPRKSTTVFEKLGDLPFKVIHAAKDFFSFLQPLGELVDMTLLGVEKVSHLAIEGFSNLVAYHHKGFFGARFNKGHTFIEKNQLPLNLFFQFESHVIHNIGQAFPTTKMAEKVCRHIAQVITSHCFNNKTHFQKKLGEDVFTHPKKCRRLVNQTVAFLIAAIRQVANDHQQPNDELTWVKRICFVAFQGKNHPKDSFISRFWEHIKSVFTSSQLRHKDMRELFHPSLLKIREISDTPLSKTMLTELTILDRLITDFPKLERRVDDNTRTIKKLTSDIEALKKRRKAKHYSSPLQTTPKIPPTYTGKKESKFEKPNKSTLKKALSCSW